MRQCLDLQLDDGRVVLEMPGPPAMRDGLTDKIRYDKQLESFMTPERLSHEPFRDFNTGIPRMR